MYNKQNLNLIEDLFLMGRSCGDTNSHCKNIEMCLKIDFFLILYINVI
jgi:hypothetical protein